MSSPIEGQVVLLATAKASVTGDRLFSLLEEAQRILEPDLESYRRRYELAHEDDDICCFFVPTDHWKEMEKNLGLERRERDALERAHEEQLKRFGKREGRREEFETALDVRSAAVIGK
ncbi:MAG: hypothetical protein IH933_05760 [Euryarchaeota archaeon]|jgi:hypothetical protein|nr:hypothetical protein [Euryarchaeota archaeon]